MNFSNVPTDQIADKNSLVSETWYNWFADLINQLQQNLSDEGYVVSGLTSDQIAQLNGLPGNTQKFVYNTSTQSMMVNNSGTFLNLTASLLLTQQQIAEFDFNKFKNGLLINTTTQDVYLIINGVRRKFILTGDP